MSTGHSDDDWSRDYVSYMRCDAGDFWLDEVEEQIKRWLRDEGLEPDLSRSGEDRSGERAVSVARSGLSGSRDLRLRLVETGSGTGRWITELLAHDEPGVEDWIHLSVANDEGRFAEVPRVAQHLLGALPLRDGAMRLRDGPHVLGADDIDPLIEVLEDESRHGVVFVAAPAAGEDRGEFVARVKEWTRTVYGLAHVFVLGGDATQAYEARVNERFHVPSGAIRLFKPGVRFSDPADGRRHRIQNAQWLDDGDPGEDRRLLGEIARNEAAHRTTPTAVRDVWRRFERMENERLLEAARMQGGPADPAASVDGEGIERAIAARIDRMQIQINLLEDDNKAILTELEDSQLTYSLRVYENDDLKARVRWLQDRLVEQGDYGTEYLDPPREYEESRPTDYPGLLQRIGELEGVEFSGDETTVFKLSSIDTNETALLAAWDSALALADYVRARKAGECTGGISRYLAETPQGYRSVSRNNFAATETAATMRAHARERDFPVPVDVDPRGHTTMTAHFKLGKIGMKSPRMYVHDCHPASPRVIIGYIGPHLTNTQTN